MKSLNGLETSRRKLIVGAMSLIAAPAIVRASSLMPINAKLSDLTRGWKWQEPQLYLDKQNLAHVLEEFRKFPYKKFTLHLTKHDNRFVYGTLVSVPMHNNS